ncbi:MAG: DUF58 domain-containing protein [Dehalococcoidales bacterium]|nr:DUF58 domain-containing protein [Dehalococcoidales bacterium]
MRSDYWLLLAVLILVISLATHQVPLALVSLLFLLAGGVSRLWNRYCLHGVEYQRRLTRNHVFFGEETVFEIEITNRKPLPLPWLHIEDELPEQVTLLKGRTQQTSEDRAILNNMLPMNMYHRVTRRFPLKCNRRGSFLFGPTRIHSGDLFGFFRRTMYIEKRDLLLVYPRLLPLEELGIPSHQCFGDIRLKQHLFQDPVLTAGVRDYFPGDSLKRIHWKSTARLGKLQTKVYEPTTTVDISMFLDVRTMEAPYWGSVQQLQELGIITAAAISQGAIDSGFRVGLYVNQITRYSRGLARVPHSQHPEQLERILELLAQVHQVENIKVEKYIRQEAPHLPWGSTIVAISAQPSDELLATLLDMKRLGRSVAFIKIGGGVPDVSRKLPVYHVTDETAWDVVTKIGLTEV